MKNNILFLLFVISSILADPCNGSDKSITTFNVQLGTLETNSEIKRRFVFRVGEEEREVFDLSILNKSGMQFSGLPDLHEIGIRCKSGKLFEYGEVSKNTFVEQFAKSHPDEELKALVFEGVTGQIIEIKIKGRTPVFRIDLKLDHRNITLWSNAEQ